MNILIIHGWPQAVTESHPLHRALTAGEHTLISPAYLDGSVKLTLAEIKRFLMEKTGGNRIDAMIGISLGGLILPQFVRPFPSAKLVFVASGVRFAPKYRIIIPALPLISGAVRNTPLSLLRRAYSLVSPFTGDERGLAWYTRDREENLRLLRNMHPENLRQIIALAKSFDNTKLLINTRNPALIIAGRNDMLMPHKGAEELHRLIVNSELFTTDGAHFNVLTEEAIMNIIKFL